MALRAARILGRRRSISERGFLVVKIMPFLLLLLTAWAIYDIFTHPLEAWERAGHSRTTWVLLCLFTNFIGALIYFAMIRPRLR